MNNKGAKTRSSTGANRENGNKNSVPSVSSCSISLFKKTGNHRRATKRRKEKKVSTGGENSDKKLCSLRFLLFNSPSPLPLPPFVPSRLCCQVQRAARSRRGE